MPPPLLFLRRRSLSSSPIGLDWHVEKTLVCEPIIQYYAVANDRTIEHMAVRHSCHFVLLWGPSGHHHHPHSARNRNLNDAARAVNCYHCRRGVPDRRSRCWYSLRVLSLTDSRSESETLPMGCTGTSWGASFAVVMMGQPRRTEAVVVAQGTRWTD